MFKKPKTNQGDKTPCTAKAEWTEPNFGYTFKADGKGSLPAAQKMHTVHSRAHSVRKERKSCHTASF
ncbi:hypothetical protein AGMMS49957_05040 [Synergistales bacterium]|nr:hypothetical protein AGMMS49957_05040 [Synergistales bacterium]